MNQQYPLPPNDPRLYQQPPAKGNTMAVVGLCTCLIAPVGLTCSIIGLKKAKALGGKGHGLALTGVILSSVILLLGAALIVWLIVDDSAFEKLEEPAQKRNIDNTNQASDISSIRASIDRYSSENTGNLPSNKADMAEALESSGDLNYYTADVKDGLGNASQTIYITKRTSTEPSDGDSVPGDEALHILLGAKCVASSADSDDEIQYEAGGLNFVQEATRRSYAIIYGKNNKTICEDNL